MKAEEKAEEVGVKKQSNFQQYQMNASLTRAVTSVNNRKPMVVIEEVEESRFEVHEFMAFLMKMGKKALI